MDRFFIREKRSIKRKNIILAANHTLSCVKAERIEPKKWEAFELDVVENEMLGIIQAVEQGKRVPFRKRKMLDSSYLLTDSVNSLTSTDIGRSIQLVQTELRKSKWFNF